MELEVSTCNRNGDPLSGAQIEVVGTGIGTYSVTTGPDGCGTIPDVPMNSFFIKCTANGYITNHSWYDLSEIASGEPSFTMCTWDEMYNSLGMISLDHSKSIIKGRVTNREKNVAGATVSITPPSGSIIYADSNGEAVFGPDCALGNGDFYIANLENGNYNISANRYDSTDKEEERYTTSSVKITEPAIYVIKPISEY